VPETETEPFTKSHASLQNYIMDEVPKNKTVS